MSNVLRTSRSEWNISYFVLIWLAFLGYFPGEKVLDRADGILLDGLDDSGELGIISLGELALMLIDS